jgi:uncharacterized membrane protein YkoI
MPAFKNKTLITALLAMLAVASPGANASLFSSSDKNYDTVLDVPLEGTRIEIGEDQDEVFDAVQKGLIKPFSALFATVENDLSGRIIKVELEEDDDEWFYELKLMHEQDIIKVEYNATTLELIELRGRNLQKVIKR